MTRTRVASTIAVVSGPAAAAGLAWQGHDAVAAIAVGSILTGGLIILAWMLSQILEHGRSTDTRPRIRWGSFVLEFIDPRRGGPNDPVDAVGAGGDLDADADLVGPAAPAGGPVAGELERDLDRAGPAEEAS